MSDPRNNRINYIEIPATDIQGSKKFFTDLFGWTFQDWGPDYVSFSDGNMDGGMRRADVQASAQKGSVLAILYFDDLEAIRDRLRKAGGTVIKDIFSFPGGRRFHFTDPSGNEFAIWSEVGAASMHPEQTGN